jgi:hypothetical protein
MAQEVLSLGTLPNDGKGDTIRVAAQKINNNFTQLFSTPLVADNLARVRANSAFDAANTKVSKTGDIITGTLIFRTNANNTSQNTKIGNIENANSLDIFAENEFGYVQLNWANTNYSYVDSFGVKNSTPNTAVELNNNQQTVLISANTINWSFNQNGIISLVDTSTNLGSILAPGYRSVRTVQVSTANATSADDIIICNPNAVGANIVVNLSSNVRTGKTYTIKNINPGGFSVNVSGTTLPYPFIEDPRTGSLVNRVVMANTGEVYTWVFDSVIYRYIE